MKRIFCILLLLALLPGAARADGAPAPEAPEGAITELFFYRAGYEAPLTLELTGEEDGPWVCIDGEPLAPADAAFLEALEESVGENGVLAWNGFSESASGVLDGELFSLRIAWENGYALTADGDNAFPENYSSFRRDLEDLFLGVGEEAPVIFFPSFDGGGMEYSALIADESVLACEAWRDYGDVDLSLIDGASYDMLFAFTGLRPGRTRLTIAGVSPIMAPEEHVYTVTVTQSLRVIIREVEPMLLTVRKITYEAYLEDNETAAAFRDLLPLELAMEELNGNEKYHYLDDPLPSAPEAVGSVRAGDIMLYGDRCVVLFYDSFETPYRYTRIGHIVAPEALDWAVGEGEALVRFE